MGRWKAGFMIFLGVLLGFGGTALILQPNPLVEYRLPWVKEEGVGHILDELDGMENYSMSVDAGGILSDNMRYFVEVMGQGIYRVEVLEDEITGNQEEFYIIRQDDTYHICGPLEGDDWRCRRYEGHIYFLELIEFRRIDPAWFVYDEENDRFTAPSSLLSPAVLCDTQREEWLPFPDEVTLNFDYFHIAAVDGVITVSFNLMDCQLTDNHEEGKQYGSCFSLLAMVLVFDDIGKVEGEPPEFIFAD